MKEHVRSTAVSLGFTTCGFASASAAASSQVLRSWLAAGMHGPMGYMERHENLRGTPRALLENAQTVVAVTLNYRQGRREGQPKIAAYALGRDYHRVLRGKLRRLASAIESQVGPHEWRVCVDSAPILEREYAHRAGLGWFGKNTCLIDTYRGSMFVIGLLLTTHLFEPDHAAKGGCGTCRICIDSCPTGAIVNHDGHWHVDARKCVSSLTIEHRGSFDESQERMVGDWTFGCDICQEVCPFNKPGERHPARGLETTEPDFSATREWPPIEQLADIEFEEWDALTRGSPVRRAGLEGIRRNARANLANLKHSGKHV